MKNSFIAHALGFAYPGSDLLFENLNFSLQKQKVGLVGHNGVGKSTLLQLIVGELEPSSGSLQRIGSTYVLKQFLQNPPPWNSSEETYPYAKYLSQLELSENLLHRDFTKLSGGEKFKLHFAHALAQSPDLLCLDEPTNHLDRINKQILIRILSSWKSALFCISHDRELLQHMDEIWELDSKGLHIYGGNYDFYFAQKESARQALSRQIEALTTGLKKAKRQAQHSKEKQESRTANAKKKAPQMGLPRIILGAKKRQAQKTAARLQDAHENIIEGRSDLLRQQRQRFIHETPLHFDFPKAAFTSAKEILRVQNANIEFDGQALWNQPLSFSLRSGERMALSGANGSGKTVLTQIILGHQKDFCGDIRLNTPRVSYLDQNLSFENTELSLLDCFLEKAPHLQQHEIRTLLGRLQFENTDVFKKIRDLSGGEKVRAALMRCHLEHESLEILILDEPTNNLDLQALAQLELALRNYQGALLVISHDQEFLKNIGIEKILQLER